MPLVHQVLPTPVFTIHDLFLQCKFNNLGGHCNWLQERELKEMAAAPSLVEQLQAANPGAAASMTQLFSIVAESQASGSGGSPFSAVADGMVTSNGFDQPKLTNFTSSTAVVTDLGVVGRGIERADSAVAETNANCNQPSKTRSFDMLMNGTGNGKTQVGFGDSTVKLVGNGTS